MEIQQLDFGGFDPSFVGVTIRFSNERAWRTFEECWRNEKVLSVSSADPHEKFETLSVVSVFSHEVRHFHDFLLTPYSAHVFRLRVQLLMNVLELFIHITQSDGNCLPVPISSWCVLGDADRDRILSQLPSRVDCEPWTPIDLPYLDAEALEARPSARLVPFSREAIKPLIAAAICSRSQIHNLSYNPETISGNNSFQPWQVFELSGLLIQIQELWNAYGQQETEFFIRYLLEDRKNPYGAMLRVTQRMWKNVKSLFDCNLTSAMVSWSLIGSYERDRWKSCPTVRFLRLWDHIRKNGVPQKPADPFELFDHWSKVLGLSTVAEGLDDTLKTFCYLRELIQTRVLNVKGRFFSKEFGPFLFNLADGVSRASKQMITEFRRNPAAYVYPNLYIENASSFANPVMRIAFDGAALQLHMTTEHLSEIGYIVERALRRDGGDLILSFLQPCSLSEFDFLNAHDVLQISAMMGLTDFLFSETARARIDIQHARRVYFSETNVKPVEILQ